MEARMDQESILYTTLTLFAAMAGLVAVVFAVIIWMVVRRCTAEGLKAVAGSGSKVTRSKGQEFKFLTLRLTTLRP